MGQSIQRIVRPAEDDPRRRSADRARLLERIAVGLAHEGKNPLHNMALHLQLMSEKLANPERAAGSPIEKHVIALRDGIGRVDALLRAFGEFAAPAHLAPDLACAADRAVRLFAYDLRRATVKVVQRGPSSLVVASDSLFLGDLVAHAFVAALELARDGGMVELEVAERGALEIRARSGVGNRAQAQPHLDAMRSLAGPASCELSIDAPPAGDAWLSLSFLLPR